MSNLERVCNFVFGLFQAPVDTSVRSVGGSDVSVACVNATFSGGATPLVLTPRHYTPSSSNGTVSGLVS